MSMFRSAQLQKALLLLVILPGVVGAVWTNYRSDAATGIAKVINYQGRLADSNGTAVTNGSYNMAFVLYDAATSGNCKWSAKGTGANGCTSPSTTMAVTVTNGDFSVLLGDTSQNALPDDLFDADTLYLEVQVNNETLTPRRRIGAAGYAFNADRLDGLETSAIGGVSAVIPVTSSSGNFVLTGTPSGTGVSQGVVYVNPASATANYTLFGVAVGGSSKFRVDAEGDATIAGTLNGLTLPSSGTLVTLAGTETLTNKTLTSPVLTTPALGIATATSINGLTISSSTGTLTITDGKTLSVTDNAIVSGTNTGDQTTVSGNAGSTTTTAITDDTTTNATMYPTWVTAATGNLAQKISSTKLSFNPSTGLLTSTGFSGPLTGNVTGNVSGTSGSTTGNAATVTGLSIASGKTLTASNTITFTADDGATLVIGSGGTLGSGAYATIGNYAPLSNPTFTGTVTIPTPFTLGATSVTSTGAQLNYLASAGGTTGTTSTNLVFSTSPTLVTPTLGVATATSINKVALTAPATGSTLTIADGKTLTANNSLTLAGTDSTTITFQGTDTYVGRATTDTLTNKTLTTPVIASISNSGTITIPTGTDTLVGRATTDTLTNKTLTSPDINGGTADALTSLGIRSTGSGAFDLTLANTENLTAGRTLTITTNDAARTINLGGNLTTAGAFITSGANSLTLTTTGSTDVTLPTTGTLATLAGSEAISNKTITSSSGAFTTLTSTGISTIGNDSATVAIDSSDWNINTTGDMTGIGAITSDGVVSITPSSNAAALTVTGTSITSAKLLNLDARNTTVAAGTGMIHLAFGAATTQGAGALVGSFMDLSTNLTTPAAGRNVSGYILKMPTLSTTSANVVYSGFDITVAGAVTNGTAGSIAWRGSNVVLPIITQSAGGTVTADGVRVLVPASGSIVTAGTMSGINVVAPTTSGPAAGTLYGVNIGALTSAGAGTETALSIGSGWDTSIDLNANILVNIGNSGTDFSSTGGLTLADNLTVTQVVKTTGSPTAMLVTGGAHTTLTASTEATDINFNLGRIVQFATGALADQRAVKVLAPTYAFVGASTLTNAATLYIDNAPTVGTNATITNNYALWVDEGAVRIDRDNITTTPTDGLVLSNTTASATDGSQYSPSLTFKGSGWIDFGLGDVASRSLDWRMYVLNNAGGGSSMVFQHNWNNEGYNTQMALGGDGSLNLGRVVGTWGNDTGADTAWSGSVFNVNNNQTGIAVTSGAIVGNYFKFTNQPEIGGNTEYAMVIENQATDNVTDNLVSALLVLNNADTTATGTTVVTSALAIGNTGGAGITNDIKLQNAETINNGTDGTVAIKDGGGTAILSASLTAFQINLGDTITYTQRLCHDGSDAATGVQSVGDCQASGQADVAEYYGSDGTLEAGDIVIASGEAQEFTGERIGQSSKASVAKSSSVYAPILGVVSTNPFSEVMGEGVFTPEEHPMPIVLVGRIPVKVNLEGGDIAAGDRITTSSVAGVGMKAKQSGWTVGVALESYNASASDNKIIVWFNPQYVLLENEDGNIGIGTDDAQYKFHVQGDVAATSFVNISTRESKKDIEYISSEDGMMMLAKLSTIKVARYHYKEESATTPLHLGLIAEEAPLEVLSASGKGVDIYKLASFTLAAVQAQQSQIEMLIDRMDELEQRLDRWTGETTRSTQQDMEALRQEVRQVRQQVTATPEAPTQPTTLLNVNDIPQTATISEVIITEPTPVTESTPAPVEEVIVAEPSSAEVTKDGPTPVASDPAPAEVSEPAPAAEPAPVTPTEVSSAPTTSESATE